MINENVHDENSDISENDEEILENDNENINDNIKQEQDNEIEDKESELDLPNPKQVKRKDFFPNENLDLNFNSSFYTNRTLEVEKLKTILSKESNHGLTGLKNLGNTSYINTAVQCLSHTLDFVYYILSQTYTNEISQKNKRSNILF